MNRRKFLRTAGWTAAASLTAGSVTSQTTTPKEKKDAPVKNLPGRSEVNSADTWDLASLFPSDQAWEEGFTVWQKQIDGYAAFQGKLADGADVLAKCLQFDLDVSRAAERLGTYAQLRTCEDQGDSASQRMRMRFMQIASQAGQASSFIRPEILAIADDRMRTFLDSPVMAPYKLLLSRILRFKPHTLGVKEERLLAMQAEVAASPIQIFRQLNDTDLKFGAVANERGKLVELSHGTFIVMLSSPSREVRARAFHKYYDQFQSHQNTLAATLNASIQQDLYQAKARGFASSLEASLFPDNVPVSVYDNLIASIHKRLPSLYHYYDVRRRKMGLSDIHHYDTYVPILSELHVTHTWDEAVQTIVAALKPLGDDYGKTLRAGLTTDRWCDRYENRGKQSGAFSAGTYDGKPYILMNYQPDVLDHVFTLAHEGGHSMHSHFSAHSQPFAYYDYSLFVAEVASTFNETLLSRRLQAEAKDDRQRAYLINHEIDSIRATIFRQTMFAEFERLTHASAEAGEPLTLERFKSIYRKLLREYFGPEFVVDDQLALECFRVPHFYRAFYVYKYATSMSAAIALVDRVLQGGQKELNDYLGLLKAGCSKDPLDLLRDAGVDLEKPGCVDRALDRFDTLVQELDTLVGR
ncbi:MAG: oligoendopeptidase F [Thermoguttaceae bacterium]